MVLNSPPPFWQIIKRAFPNASLEKQVFAFYPNVYSSVELSEDLIEHENTHLKQQRSFVGACLWWFRYVVDPVYRVRVEIEACRNQLKKANTMCLEWVNAKKITFPEYRTRMAGLLDKMARNLSSEVYNNCITYEEAANLLRQ